MNELYLTIPAILAKHEQVRSELLKRIRTGEFGQDGRLPSERQLIVEYHVSGATISRALTDLEKTGHIQRLWGKGTFVRQVMAPHLMQMGVALTSFLHMSNPWRLELLQGIELQAQQMDCRVHCFLMHDNRLLTTSQSGNLLPLMLGNGMVQGLLLATPITCEDAVELSRLAIPMVAIGSVYPGLAIVSVMEDSQAAAKQVVDHLKTLGRKRLALFPGPIYESHARMMRASSFYAQALTGCLADAGFHLDAANVHPSNYDWVAIEPIIRQYAASQDRPQVLIFRDDCQAQRAMDLLESNGLSVPDDVAVVSFGDILSDSSLTSVSVSPLAMGRRAVELLVQASSGQLNSDGHIELAPVNLRVRSSSLINRSPLLV